MSNTLGTLAGTLVIQRALELTYTKFPALAMISMGFRDLDGRVSQMNLNQVATSRLRSIPTVADFGAAAAGVTSTDVNVTLSGHKQVFHSFTAAEISSTDRNLVDEAAEPMAIAIAQHILASVSALWTSRNFTGTPVTVASGWTYANTLVALRKALSAAGVTEGRRFGVLNADVYSKLLEDTTIVAALNNPSNGDAIREGRLPRVAGLALDEYVSLPSNNGSAITLATSAAADDIIDTAAAHGLIAGDRVTFPALTGGTGLTAASVIYYVIAANLGSTTFQVSATAGGTAINFTADITAGTVQLAENLIGFAGSPDSTIYVARPPKNPEEVLAGAKFPGTIGYVTDPVTGFSVMVNQWIGTDLSVNNRLVWLEGFAKGNGNNGARLISA